MSKSHIRSYKDCMDSRKVEQAVRQKGLEVKSGKGSHKVVTAPDGTKMTLLKGPLSPNVAHNWFKRLIELGIIGCVFIGYMLLTHQWFLIL